MDTIAQLFASLLILLVALIPFWFFLIVKWLLSPEGFWQRMFVYGLGVWVLGTLQVFFLIFGLFFIIFVWSDRKH